MNSIPSKTQAGFDQARPNANSRLYTQAGILFGLVFPIAAMAIKLAQLGMSFSFHSILGLQQSESLLWIIDTAPLFLGLAGGLIGKRQDTILEMNRRLKMRENELTVIQQNLEQHVTERTQQLEERSNQMRASAHFYRQIAEIPNMSDLLAKSVDLISQHFSHDRARIFLMDNQRKTIVLQAASSEADRHLLEGGYRQEVGGLSLIGRVAGSGRPQSQQYSRQPDSPGGEVDASGNRAAEIQSEITLPLMVRGAVIGVLDIQSERSDAFTQTDAETLQLLADQIAITIENTRLLDESRALVSQLEVLTSQQTRVSWQEYLGTQKTAFQFTPSGVKAISASNMPPVRKEDLSIPIVLRGQKIGTIAFHRQENPRWVERERDLAEKVATQVALALENSRLIAETRQRAQREQTIGEISSRLSRSLDLDTLLQTAVRELGTLPNISEVSVLLTPASDETSEP